MQLKVPKMENKQVHGNCGSATNYSGIPYNLLRTIRCFIITNKISEIRTHEKSTSLKYFSLRFCRAVTNILISMGIEVR